MKTAKKILSFALAVTAVSLGALFAGTLRAGTIELSLTGDQSLADALEAYNGAHGTGYVDTDDGVSLGADDIAVSGASTLTFSRPLGKWTGNLRVQEGATVHVESDDANYATVLGAGVSGTTTNGQVFVASGASLRLRTQATGNGNKLARPVHLAGVGVDGKGALQLASTKNVRAVFPRFIHLDADAQFSRLVNGDKTCDMVMNDTTAVVLNGHVLTLAQTGSGSELNVYFEGTRFQSPGEAGGVVVTDGCTFTMRANTWEGGAGNVVGIRGTGTLIVQYDFPRAPWTLVYDTTSAFNAGNYQDWSNRDESGTWRCWTGPVQLLKDFRLVDGTKFAYQVGLRGKVTGPGGIYVADTSAADRVKWFHLVSGENDFTGGFAATNFLVRLGAPTAVPGGEGAGPMALKDCDVDLNYDVRDGDFAFPATTFEGTGTFFSKSRADGEARHAGSFASLVKTGEGTLDVQARLTGGALDIRDGCVRLGYPSTAERLAAASGVLFGQSAAFSCFGNPFTKGDEVDIGGGKRPLKEVAPSILYTNGTATALSVFSFPHGAYGDSQNPWKASFYWKLSTYAGWLWNTSSVPKTVKVVCTLNAYVRLTLGEEVYETREPTRNMLPESLIDPKGVWEMTVPPGANRFEVRVYDRYGLPSDMENGNYFCYGNVCTNGLVNWDDVHGLVWTENLASVDLRDYRRFEDGGSDLLLTRAARLESDLGTLDALSGAGTLALANGRLVVKEPAQDVPCVSATGDVALDLNGKGATTRRLDGAVRVTNGTLAVDGDWTLDEDGIKDPTVVSTGLAFTDAARLVLSEAAQRELADGMPQGGYLLATDVTGCPRLERVAGVKLSLFVRDNRLYLGRGRGTLLVVR